MSFILLSAALAAASPTTAPAGLAINDGEHLRFGSDVAELYAGRRQSAPEDTRQWLTLRLGQVGLVVVSDDGKSELLSIDKFGGVYVSGDLYVKGARVGASPAAATPGAQAATPAPAGGLGWTQLLLTALATAVVSVLVSTNISKRQPR